MHHFFLGFFIFWLFHRLVGRLFLLILVVAVIVLYFQLQQERARNRGPRWD